MIVLRTKKGKIIQLKFDGYYTEKQLPPPNHDGPGIYVVYRGTTEKLQELLYIGRSNDVNDRPGPNHENYNEWRRQRIPGERLYFTFADAKDEKEEKRAEAALIFHTKPRCNHTGKDGFHYNTTVIFTTGKNDGLDSSFTVPSTD